MTADGSTSGITSVLVFGAGTNHALLLISLSRGTAPYIPPPPGVADRRYHAGPAIVAKQRHRGAGPVDVAVRLLAQHPKPGCAGSLRMLVAIFDAAGAAAAAGVVRPEVDSGPSSPGQRRRHRRHRRLAPNSPTGCPGTPPGGRGVDRHSSPYWPPRLPPIRWVSTRSTVPGECADSVTGFWNAFGALPNGLLTHPRHQVAPTRPTPSARAIQSTRAWVSASQPVSPHGTDPVAGASPTPPASQRALRYRCRTPWSSAGRRDPPPLVGGRTRRPWMPRTRPSTTAGGDPHKSRGARGPLCSVAGGAHLRFWSPRPCCRRWPRSAGQLGQRCILPGFRPWTSCHPLFAFLFLVALSVIPHHLVTCARRRPDVRHPLAASRAGGVGHRRGDHEVQESFWPRFCGMACCR